MKLIVAIVRDDTMRALNEILTDAGYMFTKVASSGGFLKLGNTTLLMGVDDEKVEEVISMIKDCCTTRQEYMSLGVPIPSQGGFIPPPVKVAHGGATVFVMNVESFTKV